MKGALDLVTADFAYVSVQRPGFLRSVTVRDYLKQFVEDMDKRIALTAPHCEIQKVN